MSFRSDVKQIRVVKWRYEVWDGDVDVAFTSGGQGSRQWQGLAHEQVLFGGPGEALTIRQDSFDRDSFMSGVKVALEKVDQLTELVICLENIL